MEPDSVTDDPQERWARLCRYLSKSVLAEMADTLVRLRATDKWFLHDTESEGLVTGALDCAAIPERLGKCFDKAGGHSAMHLLLVDVRVEVEVCGLQTAVSEYESAMNERGSRFCAMPSR